MSENYEHVMQAALSLPVAEQLLIADALLGSAQREESEEWRKAWSAELQRRADEFDAHPESGMSWEEVKAFARRSAKRA